MALCNVTPYATGDKISLLLKILLGGYNIFDSRKTFLVPYRN